MDIHINTKNTIIPMYEDVLDDVLDHKHTHYVFQVAEVLQSRHFLVV